MKISVIILKSELDRDHILWIEACKKNIEIGSYQIIDITKNDWLDKIKKLQFDIILCRPPGISTFFKTLYDERIMILSSFCGYKIYPSLQEIYLYENKKLLKDWLVAKEIKHPKTFVSFDFNDVDEYIRLKNNYPIVAKTNIGASGNGVVVLKTIEEAKIYVKNVFGRGIKSKSGPKWFKGNLIKKIKKLITNRKFISQRMKEYSMSRNEIQKDFVFFQEFIPHEFEWRCVIIGDSFFAHKKVAVNNISSGKLIKDYNNIPIKLLDYLLEFSEKTRLNSLALDLFESDGDYLVNEIQCFFGQSDPYQMLVNDKPGRYQFNGKEWVFEEGMFNTNQCYDLRLTHAIEQLFKVI